MADSPLPEVESTPQESPQARKSFGVALEPQVVKISVYAVLIGAVSGLVAEGLLESSTSSRIFASTGAFRSPM